jgi:hypothetical protein
VVRKLASVIAGLVIVAAAAAVAAVPAAGSRPLGSRPLGSRPLGSGSPGPAQRPPGQAEPLLAGYVSPDQANSVVPVVLNITKAGLLIAELSPDPTVSGLATLGVHLSNHLQGELSTAHAADPAATLLVVVHTVQGKQEANVYRITAGRHIQVAMNGRFIEEVSPGEIKITAQPGTESTIAVTITSNGPRSTARAR